MKKSLLLATAIVASLTSGIASADLTANAGVFSNYIWRGVTQTNDAAAGQGGIDWTADSGLYAGTWVSTLGNGNGYEMDLYGGYTGKINDFGYDASVISYQYPVTSPSTSFTEIDVSGSYSLVTLGAAYTIDAASANNNSAFDKGDLYLSASVDFAVNKSDVSFYAGTYRFTNDGNPGIGAINYSHLGASISKDGFTFAADKNNIDANNTALGAANGTADNVRVTVSYSKDFQL